MKIIIENTQFSYDTGLRLLKLKHNICPFKELEDIWDKIVPMSFMEIAAFENLEHRRVGVLCLGLERLASEVKPKLISEKVLKKTTTWIDKDGKVVTKKFADTYELYEVSGEYFSKGTSQWQRVENSYFIKCKDTSTDREYFIWVDPRSVYRTNHDHDKYGSDFDIRKVTAIACVAWTIQTNVQKGNIEKILRQGDCIMVKPKVIGDFLSIPRHLTEKEYKTLLVAES